MESGTIAIIIVVKLFIFLVFVVCRWYLWSERRKQPRHGLTQVTVTRGSSHGRRVPPSIATVSVVSARPNTRPTDVYAYAQGKECPLCPATLRPSAWPAHKAECAAKNPDLLRDLGKENNVIA